MQPLEITIHTDGTGVVWDPHEPHHLDAILAYRQRALTGASFDCDPEAPPAEDELPLARWTSGAQWGWRASVLFPVGNALESTQWARRRFDESRIHLQSSPTINTAAGLCKTTNMPWPITLATSWRAWCVGDADTIRHLLAGLRGIGRERARGRGRVVSLEVRPSDRDSSVSWGGIAMRYVPMAGSSRLARCRPPYWHTHDRCEVTSVGDPLPCEP